MKEELLRLAERCEKATGPDRELDAAIAIGLGAVSVDLDGGGNGLMLFDKSGGPLPRWTASLDAAMTLVPEGSGFDLRKCVSSLGIVSLYPHGFTKEVVEARAQTTALALCAAALRASVKEQNNGG